MYVKSLEDLFTKTILEKSQHYFSYVQYRVKSPTVYTTTFTQETSSIICLVQYCKAKKKIILLTTFNESGFKGKEKGKSQFLED
jgi:hypothetical protein